MAKDEKKTESTSKAGERTEKKPEAEGTLAVLPSKSAKGGSQPKADQPMAGAEKIGGKKKKIRSQVQKGQAHIQCTYNNTLIAVTDASGAMLGWSSSGLLGFKGAKKATSYAATQVAGDVAAKVGKFGISSLDVFVKGVGSGREAAIRALANKGFNLLSIKDITSIPHNGCRPRKPRRV